MPVGFFDDPSFRWSMAAPANLATAEKAGASIVHVLADWSQIAPEKPASPLNGSDPAYNLSDLDALVRTAPRYDQQVLMTISGTPKWANGGKTPNVAPTNMNDLTLFARMLATRYNGLRAGFGAVTRYSVWNEPNLDLFLKPQFRGNKIVSPEIYVKLYMATYRGIKAGNPRAEVAGGGTSNRGRNRQLPGVSGSVAPATFARLVSDLAPRLPISAWATHPYPSEPRFGPLQKVAYPNVALTNMERFGKDLEKWFGKRVPIWITEYAEQTSPESFLGVSRAKQAVDARVALELAAANPYVEMFIWFVLRDSTDKTWRSGLLTRTGAKKPAYASFQRAAKKIEGVSQIVKAGRNPTIKLPVPYLTFYNKVGNIVGITYRVFEGRKFIWIAQPRGRIAADQTVSFVARFRPEKGKTYVVTAEVNDRGGLHTTRSVAVTAT
jgi:hypothetical protein